MKNLHRLFDSHLRSIFFTIVLLYAFPRISGYFNALETPYIEYYGNDPFNVTRWEAVKDWFLEDGEPKLKKFCAEVHKLAGKGTYPVEWVFLQIQLLQFKDPDYIKRLADVVSYKIRVPVNRTDILDIFLIPDLKGPWHLIQGLRPDCVYYVHKDYQNELVLQEHVCGIEIESDATTVKKSSESIDRVAV